MSVAARKPSADTQLRAWLAAEWRHELGRRVSWFRQEHRVTDARCAAMIRALRDGRAYSIEEAFRVTG